MNGFQTVSLAGLRNRGHRNAWIGNRWLWGQAGDTEPAEVDRATELAGLAGLPTGEQRFWGIPFDIADDADNDGATWIVLGNELWPELPESTSVPIGATARYVLVCHFLDAVPNPELEHESEHDTLDDPGAHVATYTLRYGDEEMHAHQIRSRFEINPYQRPWGREAFGAVEHNEFLPYATVGADRQGLTGLLDKAGSGNYLIAALENPRPDFEIESIELKAVGDRVVAIAAITLCEHPDNPLKRSPLSRIRADVQGGGALTHAEIDLGQVAGAYPVSGGLPDGWTDDPAKGAGVKNEESAGATLIEAYGAESATLTVGSESAKSSARWGDVLKEKDLTAGQVRLRVIHDERSWVHVKVRDRETGSSTPARVHFSGPHGEYLAPHGHQREINTNWCEDLGGDLKLGDTGYAYVNGEFQIDLPVGDVFVEVLKGFEYEPVRRRVRVEPGQRELVLEVSRWANQAGAGYFSGDTHVHFLDPSTAMLEAEGEDLNVVNVLAAQWGRLFTDTERFTGGLAPASTEDTLVWVGSENRHHMLGHMSLLGITSPIYPLSSGGPAEDYLGGSEEVLMAEWADAAHEQGALVVTPHFPSPHCEIAADIALGKIDAAEIKYFTARMRGASIAAWYRYLNCGYRLPAVGGTDKMLNTIPVGGVRTYAYVGKDQAFTHENWRAAIKGGHTFTTSGPLMEFTVEGLPPGGSLSLADGGTVEISARARSALPFTRLEVVANGQVVADSDTDATGREASLSFRHEINESCWLAARCYGEIDLLHAWVNKVAAHTSPVYVDVGGKHVFSPSDAAYMLTLIDGGITYLTEIAAYRDLSKRERHVKILEAGKQAIHQRIHDHGVAH